MNANRTLEILECAKNTLDTAECGLQMVVSANPGVRLIGFRNLVVFGRAVTNVLQQLRSVATGFDEWYQPRVEKMRQDTIMTYVYKLRSEILKEGRLRTGTMGNLHIETQALREAFPAPPGAKGFFIFDRCGGSGWEINLPNGEVEKFYVSIPEGLPGVELDLHLFLAGAPKEVQEIPLPRIAEYYFGKMKEIYLDAVRRFSVA